MTREEIAVEVQDVLDSFKGGWPRESLEMLDCIIDLEDRFDIVISDADAAEIHNKEDIIKTIMEKLDVD
jgi:acyl carrier protein